MSALAETGIFNRPPLLRTAMDDVTTHRPTDTNTHSDPSLDLLGDLEQRLGALKRWQQESQDQASEVERRAAEVEEQRRELEAEAARVEEQRAQASQERQLLDERRTELEAEAERLAAEQAALGGQREEAEAAAAAVEEQRLALAGERAALEDRVGEAVQSGDKARELEEAAADLAAREASIAQRAEALDHRQQELDAAAADADARTTELQIRSDKLDALGEELDGELAHLNAFEEQLETKNNELTAREAALVDAEERASNAQRSASETVAEADAALAAEVASLSATLADRQEELDGARAELDLATGRVRELDAALAEAQEAAASAAAGADSLGSPPAGVSAEEVEAMRTELDKRAHNLKRAKKKIMLLQEQVQSAADSNGESAIFSSGDLDLGEVTDLRMKLETREQELEEARKRLDAQDTEIAKLRVRVEELVKRGGRSGSALPGDTPDHAARAMELDELSAQVTADRNRVLERKAQLKAADALIKSRREKIRLYIGEFRKNNGRAKGGSGNVGLDANKLAKLERERVTLLEVKRFLQSSEAAMIKRWALQKSASVATALVIAVCAALAVSWTAANVIAKPVYEATLTLELKDQPSDEALPPGVWLSGYGRDLLSASVLGEIQNQLEQRNLRLAGTVEGLRSRLEGALEVSGSREELEVTFKDIDPSLTTPVLDAVGRGLMIHHMAQDRRAGRISDTARIQSEAVMRDRPVEDERFRWFGMILAGFAGLALLVAVPAHFLAGRANPMLRDGAVPELAALDHPSPLLAEAMQAAEAAAAEDDNAGDVIEPVFRF